LIVTLEYLLKQETTEKMFIFDFVNPEHTDLELPMNLRWIDDFYRVNAEQVPKTSRSN
jgi:hypothetical protein